MSIDYMRNKLKLSVLGFSILGVSIFGASVLGRTEGYFVAPNGSDNNPGTIDRPFKTAQQCANVVKPGETCWLRAGVYRETIKPLVSGTESEPITFAAYRDEVVTISGTEMVSGWTSYEGSILRTKAELPVDGYSDTGFFANQVFVDGKMMPEARWPNMREDFLNPKLQGGGAIKSQGKRVITIEDDELPKLEEEWIGATVWTNEWFVSRTGTITDIEDGKLTAEVTGSWKRAGFWFFLVGKLGLLDSEGEWFYDGEQRNLYLWSPEGNSPNTVEVKQRNFAFDLGDRSYIEIRDLNLFANTITTSDRSTRIVIDGIEAKYISHHVTLPPLPKSEHASNADNLLLVASHAHDTGIQLRGTNHTIKNSIIEWSSGNGVLLEGENHTVTNNVIASTNYRVSYAASVRINGNGHKITHNTIRRTGRDAISIDWHTAGTNARNIEIAYNDISRFGMLSTDLGALYVCCRVNLEGGSIHHNWIHDAKAYSPFWGTRGIYLDLESYNATVHHNVIWGIKGGKHSFYLTARGVRGDQQIFNNTFMGKVGTDRHVEARNNIFAASEKIESDRQSHNLFKNEDVQFVKSPVPKSKDLPDFSLQPDSSAIDAGVVIPGITKDFAGDAPDIGAYEHGKKPWKPGSSLEYNWQN